MTDTTTTPTPKAPPPAPPPPGQLDKLRKPGTILKMIVTIPILLISARLTEVFIRMTKEGTVRVFKRRHFDFEKELEDNWEVIRKELD